MRALLGTLLMLGACATQPVEGPAPPREDTCGLGEFRHLLGTEGAPIDRASLPAQTRILRPNDAMTMDYSAERLNIMLDDNGVVTDLRCF